MNFRTEVVPLPFSDKNKITYRHRSLAMGSCFAQNVGNKLLEARFSALVNPFGVQYNPLSIAACLQRALDGNAFEKNEVFEYKSLWHSLLHDSSFSGATAAAVLQKINSALEETIQFLQKANFLILSFGTSWVFEQRENGKIVSNCHKLPAENFRPRSLSVEEISDRYTVLLQALAKFNPHLQTIFTVSPVRHLKNGAHRNALSKATLLLAVDQIIQRNEKTMYFPAYEILTDELRDYRFFAADMCHPSQQAIDYIWEKFAESFFDSETTEILRRVEHLNAALNHRPLHPESDEYRLFQQKIHQQKSDILAEYPFLQL